MRNMMYCIQVKAFLNFYIVLHYSPKRFWHYYPWSLGHIFQSLNHLGCLGSIQPMLQVTALQANQSHEPSLPSQVPILLLGWEKLNDYVSCSRTQMSWPGFEPTSRWLNHPNLSPVLFSARPQQIDCKAIRLFQILPQMFWLSVLLFHPAGENIFDWKQIFLRSFGATCV